MPFEKPPLPPSVPSEKEADSNKAEKREQHEAALKNLKFALDVGERVGDINYKITSGFLDTHGEIKSLAAVHADVEKLQREIFNTLCDQQGIDHQARVWAIEYEFTTAAEDPDPRPWSERKYEEYGWFPKEGDTKIGNY